MFHVIGDSPTCGPRRKAPSMSHRPQLPRHAPRLVRPLPANDNVATLAHARSSASVSSEAMN